ncbi:maleylpyruvate isomerase family mycothiol-dependent enzyme [Nocardia wallacei]|uniref:Mycothiol-dependent maleylpyruvate isomerase metal-binding domain-containing protein n=1 Tax=Nocardia wallacei TaxID=480035 RepID=A0A7G1KYZ0_9NOCA|nr:maleylpyruvate isomerase family mycothiol-dependent enzyme [Nocardia wallacei]BCK59239.1 hypothetical protein NWFMUON74_70110 [Nocardia wallacei]
MIETNDERSRAWAPVLETAQIEAAVRVERLRLCEFLAGLGADEWSTPSLCAAWTVHEVLAHLTTTTRTSVWSVVKEAIRARGSFDRMEATVARERAARLPAAELIEQLRESAESSRRTPFSSPMDPLMDVLVHGQDIARPLRRSLPLLPEHAVPVLHYVVGNRFLGAPARLSGLKLVATDMDWESGTGPEITGKAADLLLAATGRPVALEQLAGPGAGVLAHRIAG